MTIRGTGKAQLWRTGQDVEAEEVEKMTDSRSHWDNTYTSKAETEVSWFQAGQGRSFELITGAAPLPDTSIIDVGGGESRLTGHLVAAGYLDLTVLDISEVALSHTKQRLSPTINEVSWIAADITQWKPIRTWDVWHDRAVFHFLTDNGAQDAYISALRQGTKSGSTVILSTFALTGPEKCSGLPIQRYSADTLAERLGSNFALCTTVTELHRTPFGTTQEFMYAGFRRQKI